MCPWFAGIHRPRSDPLLEKYHGGGGGAESLGSGSSCYSSQRSSPALSSTTNNHDSPLHPPIARSLSHLLLEEDEEETNVDTGVPISLTPSDTSVKTVCRSASTDHLLPLSSERPAAVGASSAEALAKELMECLPQTHLHLQGSSGKCVPAGCAANKGCDSRTVVAGQSLCKESAVENRMISELLSTRANRQEPVDEFFI